MEHDSPAKPGLLIVGGSASHRGGIESFCDEAQSRLEGGGTFAVRRLQADTAYLSLQRVPGLLKPLMQILVHRARGVRFAWIQYGNIFDLLFVALARVVGYRVAVTPHLGTNWRSQQHPVLRRFSTALLSRAHLLALISDTQKVELVLPAKVRTTRIRNFLTVGVLQQDDIAHADTEELRLLHAGRLSEGKGTFRALEVCEQLRSNGVPVSLTITGSADQHTLDRLQAEVVDRDLEGHVRFKGRVSDAELVRELASADVLVHLSVIDSYPLIVLEALASGTFPVCIDLAGAADMIATYDGAAVPERAAVERAVEVLTATNVREVRDRAEIASTLVRSDYSTAETSRKLHNAMAELTI